MALKGKARPEKTRNGQLNCVVAWRRAEHAQQQWLMMTFTSISIKYLFQRHLMRPKKLSNYKFYSLIEPNDLSFPNQKNSFDEVSTWQSIYNFALV